MQFGEELQHLSELLRISAETILQISDIRGGDRAQLSSLASEVDDLAEQLMAIGLRTGRSSRH